MENRCKFWLPKKNRFCANAPLSNSSFCGNHSKRSNGEWIPCPIDPSHSLLQENLEGHLNRCPLLKQSQTLFFKSYYHKGINAGKEEEREGDAVKPTIVEDVLFSNDANSCSLDGVTSEMKRNAVFNLTLPQFYELIRKIESVHHTICKDIRESYKIPEACDIWIKREVDRKLPFQEKHVVQQASIVGNLEAFGVLKESVNWQQCESGEPYGVPCVVEFGAGRGYLTQMLADCYGIKKVFLVERKSYKLKADRSLRQKERLILERLRIDIEDLNLNAVESLCGCSYIAIGKHLCGPATDLSLRCCLGKYSGDGSVEQRGQNPFLRGLAIATCCHHLCQWKHYINKSYLSKLGISKEEFHAITWFTSWAVDGDHGSSVSDVIDRGMHIQSIEEHSGSVADTVRKMEQSERAILGFMCKQIIDIGRLMWIKECGLESELVKYVPPSISPENHLLIGRHVCQF